jgi:hypothetical protein
MKTSMLVAIVVVVSVITSGLLLTCWFQSKTKDKPNFLFTMQEGRDRVCVYLTPKYYHKRSLEEICLWYHRNHLSERNLNVLFFTDEALMESFINDPVSPFDESEGKITGEASSSRRSMYDATCFRCPSEPLLKSEADPSSSGFDLTLIYAPDLKQPNVEKNSRSQRVNLD